MANAHDRHWLGRWDETRRWEGTWRVEGTGKELGGIYDVDTRELTVFGGQLADMAPVRVHGDCSGIPVTLFNCNHLSVDDRGMKARAQVLSASLFLVGSHLASNTPPEVSVARWKNPLLTHWAHRPPLSIARRTGGITVSADFHEAATFKFRGDSQLGLHQTVHGPTHPVRYNASITATEGFEVRTVSPAKLHEVYWHWVIPMDRLLALFCGRKAGFRELQVQIHGAGDEWLDVHYEPLSSESSDEMDDYYVAMPFESSRFATLLQNWLKFHDNLPVVCSALLDGGTWSLSPYARYMVLISAAEALARNLHEATKQEKAEHRKKVSEILRAVEPTYRDWVSSRINQVLSFEDVLLRLYRSADPREVWALSHFLGQDWLKTLKDARNAYAHSLKKKNQFDEVHLAIMSQCVDVWLRSTIFRAIGASDEELDRAIKRNRVNRDLQYTTVEKLTDT